MEDLFSSKNISSQRFMKVYTIGVAMGGPRGPAHPKLNVANDKNVTTKPIVTLFSVSVIILENNSACVQQ